MKLRWFRLLFINLPLILFILLFTYITVNLLPTLPNNENIFIEYFTAHLALFYLPLSLFIFFILLYILNGAKLAAKYTHLTNKTITKQAVKYVFSLVLIIGIAFPVSLAVTYVYAFAQINYHILSYNTGATEKQFLTTPQAIADAIALTDELKVVELNPATYKKDLLLMSLQKKQGFYDDRILPAFPLALYKRSYLPPSNIAFINNKLAITSITPGQMTIISPALGKFLMEYSLEHSITKGLPTVRILEKPEYLAVRKKHMASQRKLIDTVIDTVDGSIASVSGYIATNEESIAKNREIIAKANEQLQKSKCKTKEKCDAQKEKYAKIIAHANNNIAKAETALQQNQTVLGTTVQNKEKLQTEMTTIAVAEELTGFELGLFTPPNEITMTIMDQNNPQAFDVYMQTLLHEYFHYISYANEETRLHPFFEEALTEYFARMAFENYTGHNIDIGYKIGIRIIEGMVRTIPERQLLEIYYSKDQQKLEALLNSAFGKNFYSNNQEAFDMINHLPLVEQVTVANLILQQIGGEKLHITEKSKTQEFKLPSPNEKTKTPTDTKSTTPAPKL